MTSKPSLSSVLQKLDEAGHRTTAPRLAILAAAAEAGDQFSADEIARQLPRLGRATVFRTLKMLVDLDVLCRVLHDDGTLRYRWSRRGHHHHLVCTDCGAVQDFAACDVVSLVDDVVQRTQFSIEGHWLEVYGRCGACIARRARTPVAGA
jgi:Fur family transcriptional regulator, ferric uptake regulator